MCCRKKPRLVFLVSCLICIVCTLALQVQAQELSVTSLPGDVLHDTTGSWCDSGTIPIHIRIDGVEPGQVGTIEWVDSSLEISCEMGPGLKSTPTRNILFFDITLQELPSVQHIDLNDPDAAQKLQYDYIRFKVSKKYPYDVVVCEYTVINTQYGLLVSALRGDALIQSLPQLLNDRADSGFDTAVLTAICLLVAICVALTAGRTLFAALKNRLTYARSSSAHCVEK